MDLTLSQQNSEHDGDFTVIFCLNGKTTTPNSGNTSAGVGMGRSQDVSLEVKCP